MAIPFTLNILRGDTAVLTISNLGPLSNRTHLYFTIKSSFNNLDSASIFQVEEIQGLLVLNGTPITLLTTPSSMDANLSVNDEMMGNVIITIKPNVTSVLIPASNLYCDIQLVHTNGNVITLNSGSINLNADVTRSIT